MLIISNGVPKSGSSYLFKLQRDLIQSSIESENAVSKAISENKINGSGLFLSNLDDRVFALLKQISKDHGPLAVKIHDKNISKIQKYAEEKNIYSTFTYRDPRCFILSAIDHKERTNNNHQVFSHFENVTAAIPEAKSWAKVAVLYRESSIFTLKYEKLVTAPISSTEEMAKYLSLPLNSSEALNICKREEADRKYGVRQFNKGYVTRYDKEMSAMEINECNIAFAEDLQLLGYK